MIERTPGLRIAVLVKAVPVVNDIQVDPANRGAVMPDASVMNTYDVYGVSTAIGIRERFGGSITALGVGGPAAREQLVRAMATGVDDAILVTNPELASASATVLARALAESLQDGDFDIIITGQSSEDTETGLMGTLVAEVLDLPHISLVTQVDLEDSSILVHRDAEGVKQHVRCPLPVVLQVLTGRDGEQRFPTLRGMMQAKKKPLHEVTSTVDGTATVLEWSAPVAPQREATGIIVRDKPAAEAAAELVAWLREQKLV